MTNKSLHFLFASFFLSVACVVWTGCATTSPTGGGASSVDENDSSVFSNTDERKSSAENDLSKKDSKEKDSEEPHGANLNTKKSISSLFLPSTRRTARAMILPRFPNSCPRPAKNSERFLILATTRGKPVQGTRRKRAPSAPPSRLFFPKTMRVRLRVGKAPRKFRPSLWVNQLMYHHRFLPQTILHPLN